jgi:hypothetical protein
MLMMVLINNILENMWMEKLLFKVMKDKKLIMKKLCKVMVKK